MEEEGRHFRSGNSTGESRVRREFGKLKAGAEQGRAWSEASSASSAESRHVGPCGVPAACSALHAGAGRGEQSTHVTKLLQQSEQWWLGPGREQ